jgi:hypothetical protein
VLIPSPFDFISAHIHLVGWGTFILLSFKTVRFMTRAEQRFNEIHTAVTNHLVHAMADMNEKLAVLVDRGK